MGKLDDRTVLVSGGARGIGAAIARAVVGEGGRVVIGDVLDDEGAQIVTELGEERARFVHLDVTDGAQWREAVATAESTFGPMNVLVNNAGIVRWGNVADLDPAAWDEVLGVNLTGVFLGMQAAIPSLRRAGGGSIVNVSTAGLVGYASSPPTWPASGACGADQERCARARPDGIRVNSVHPGLTRTPMTELTDPALIALRDQVLALQPILAWARRMRWLGS